MLFLYSEHPLISELFLILFHLVSLVLWPLCLCTPASESVNDVYFSKMASFRLQYQVEFALNGFSPLTLSANSEKVSPAGLLLRTCVLPAPFTDLHCSTFPQALNLTVHFIMFSSCKAGTILYQILHGQRLAQCLAILACLSFTAFFLFYFPLSVLSVCVHMHTFF